MMGHVRSLWRIRVSTNLIALFYLFSFSSIDQGELNLIRFIRHFRSKPVMHSEAPHLHFSSREAYEMLHCGPSICLSGADSCSRAKESAVAIAEKSRTRDGQENKC